MTREGLRRSTVCVVGSPGRGAVCSDLGCVRHWQKQALVCTWGHLHVGTDSAARHSSLFCEYRWKQGLELLRTLEGWNNESHKALTASPTLFMPSAVHKCTGLSGFVLVLGVGTCICPWHDTGMQGAGPIWQYYGLPHGHTNNGLLYFLKAFAVH